MMRSTFIGVVLLAFAIAGCQRDSNTPSDGRAKEEFPAPKESPERTAFLKTAAKKKEFDDNRAATEKASQAEQVAYRSKIGHPTFFDSNLGPSQDQSPEAVAARRGLAEIVNTRGKELRDLTKGRAEFTHSEYFPELLKYSEFCHKTFLAEPNKSNGGELVKLIEELYDNGNVDEAYLYSNDLLKNGFDSAQLHDLVAASAYCTDHFPEAAENFEKARNSGQFVRASLVTNMEDIGNAQKAWETEVKIRAQEAADDNLPRVKLATDEGDIVIELFENEAPETAANYISLVESGYYDNTEFYSVVLTSHMFHGCKTGDNRSTPGYRIYCESDKPNSRFPFRGALAMFIPEKDQGGSIYTVSIRPQPFNVGYVTTFGRIIEGFDVLPKIAKMNLRFPTEGMVATKVNKATVLRKRDHEYKPHKVE